MYTKSMKSKKPSPPSKKQNKAWQQKLEIRLKHEKLFLNHPQGKERFEKIIRSVSNKKPKNES